MLDSLTGLPNPAWLFLANVVSHMAWEMAPLRHIRMACLSMLNETFDESVRSTFQGLKPLKSAILILSTVKCKMIEKIL